MNSDPYTLVLMIWAALQLTWVTMLMFVQFVQISRALTTYENMRGAHHSHGKASDAVTNALMTGATSWSGSQIGSTGMGPDPALPPTHAPGHHHHKEGCFAQWKKMLGVDVFVDTAKETYGSSGNRSRQSRNPFSNGCMGNCKDFWFDPAPVFGKRENGSAQLGGQTVDYTSMYETPRLGTRRRGGGEAGAYEAVAADETV